MKKFLILMTAVLTVSCASNNKEEETVFVKVDLDATPSAKNTADFLKRLSIRLVPLETTDASLFSGSSTIMVSGNDIFINYASPMSNSYLLHFDGNGRFIGKIDRRGHGPGEYTGGYTKYVSDGKIYVSDFGNILVYDLEGTHLYSLPLKDPGSMIVTPLGIMITSSYDKEYVLNIYDKTSGEKTAQYLPNEEILADMQYVRAPYNAVGIYNGGIHATKYFDYSIYYIRDGEVATLFKFDFGSKNMPNDMLAGSPDDIADRFEDYRYETVMSIGRITLNDNWLIFSPELEDAPIVYYDRKKGSYMTNKGFDIPYSTLFGGYKPPNGQTESGEYYSLVESYALSEMILELAGKDKDYLSKYPFLKGIDPVRINEDDNPWAVFYTID